MSQLRAGALLSYISLIITIMIAILYTPIIIRLLGQNEYGLFMLIGSIATYFSVMDMGLGNAIVRFTARNRALGDKEQESRLNGTFIMLYSIIGLLTVIVGIMLYFKVESIFGTSLTNVEIEKAKIMVIVLIVNFALSFPLSVYGSIIQAYERFVIVKLVAIARTLFTPIITLPILFLGYGSVSMIIVTTIVNLSCLLFNMYYGLKYLKIKFYFGKIDKSILKEILVYSFFIFLNIIVDQVYWSTDQLILGIVSGTIPVAIYAIAMQFIKLYMQFSTSISGLFLPKVSIMVANRESNQALSNMMIKFGRLQYILIAFILSGFYLFGKEFIVFWAGPDYINAYYITIIIMIPLTIPLIQNIGISILYAKNIQVFRILLFTIISIINIFITIPLAIKFGGLGAALATAISLTIGHIVVMNFYYQFKVQLDMILFWKNIIKISIPVFISILVGLLINTILVENTLVIFSMKIIVFTIAYLVLMCVVGFNSYEKQLFFSILNAWKKVPKAVSKLLTKIKKT